MYHCRIIHKDVWTKGTNAPKKSIHLWENSKFQIKLTTTQGINKTSNNIFQIKLRTTQS